MGILSIGLGDNARARAALVKSTALYRDLGDPTRLAQALAMGVLAAGFSGDIESVRQEVAECLALAEQTGDTFSRAMALGVMGNMVLYIDRDLVQWREIMQESQALLQLPRYEWYLGTNYIAMGGGTFLAGEYAESREWFEKAMAVFRRQEDERFYNAGRSGLADIARAQGDDEEAVRLYREVLVKWQQIDNRGAVARCLECLAFIAIQAAQANPDQRSQQVRHAATLLGAAEGIRQVNQAPMTPVERPEYESQVDALRALALPGALEQAWAAGRAMDLDSAVAYAMEEISG
jgi:tetratricopeptide (TPR) repeat protein